MINDITVTDAMIEAGREAVFDLTEDEARRCYVAMERERARAWELPWIDYRLQKLLEAERDACAQIAREHAEACRELGFEDSVDVAVSIARSIAARRKTP
jgi:hypothetical protein